MEYFKCHWCGSTHNRYQASCPKCGGGLDHKSILNKSHLNSQVLNDNELSLTVRKILWILVLICVLLAAASAFYLLNRKPNSTEKISLNTTVHKNEQVVLNPKVNSGYRQSKVLLKENSNYLVKKVNNCVLNFDKNITPKVFLVSSYKGLLVSKVQFGSSGHEVRESEVIVNKPGAKIILVLMAYDPVVWKIQKTFDSSVLGVILAGYHDQVVIGLPKTTPILEAIYKKKTSCKYFYDNLKPGGQKHYIAKRIQDIVGTRPTEYITSPHNNKFYVGNTTLTSPLIQYSNETQQTVLKQYLIEKGYTIDTVASKEAGLIELLNQGKIRVASASDIENWSKIASQYSSGKHLMRLGHTFVILKKMQFPRGMYGAYSRSFIVNNNVSIPTGDKGHNRIYLMDGGVCMGSIC